MSHSSGRYMALDVGTVWTGIALADPLGITTRPLTTLATKELLTALPGLCTLHLVHTIVVGMPVTMKGTTSDQTRWTQDYVDRLKKALPHLTIATFDERLSSRHAQNLQRSRRSTPQTVAGRKQAKWEEHAQAAALVLDTYLLAQRLAAPASDSEC